VSDLPNRYVLGFMFTPDAGHVVLKLKKRPAWQRHRFNGVGGHVKVDETPLQAMMREFEEETCVPHNDWRYVCDLSGGWGIIHVFAAFSHAAGDIEAPDDEPVYEFPVNELPANCIPNVRWLVEMCRSFLLGETAQGFLVTEVTE
jgi:8-oxo-dGTP diphosphatase